MLYWTELYYHEWQVENSIKMTGGFLLGHLFPVTKIVRLERSLNTLGLRNSIKSFLRNTKKRLKLVLYRGKKRFCPVCGGHSRKFLSYGINPRVDAQCPYCGALERHRLLALFLKLREYLFEKTPQKMLHIAPEQCLEPYFRDIFRDGYISADLHNPQAMIKMDITDIQYSKHFFDAIYCSHVLEHVDDDRLALSELYRVLKNDGWAIINVPITSERTYEDPTIVDPQERKEKFGQGDHVRRYGPDFHQRIKEPGFIVEMIQTEDFVDDEIRNKVGLSLSNDTIFFCRK